MSILPINRQLDPLYVLIQRKRNFELIFGMKHYCIFAGVMPHCLDQSTVEEISYETFGGSEWEKNMMLAGDAISSRSKKQ